MRDVLTTAEIHKLVTDAGYIPEESINSIAVRAARLGAERERERAARVCEAEQRDRLERGRNPFPGDDADAQAHKAITAGKLAAAIRRGEEG